MKYYLEDTWLHIGIDSLFVKSIQEFFDAYIPSRRVQHLLIQNKDIRLDGNQVKREDDIVGLDLDLNIYPETYVYEKVNNRIEVVYEDELVLIVNKPKDLLVHSDGTKEMTLTRMVESYYADQPFVSAHSLHRLDKETGGLVVFSKSVVFQPLLDKLLSEKQIRREYLAFVEGKLEPGTIMSIDNPIGKDRHNAQKRVIYQGGLPALTKVRVLGYEPKKDYSVLSCTLDSGRTHQIRVHLASVGHPILNDELYGHPSGLCKRMGLFARNIEMYHPLQEDTLNIEASLPAELEKLYMEAM